MTALLYPLLVVASFAYVVLRVTYGALALALKSYWAAV